MYLSSILCLLFLTATVYCDEDNQARLLVSKSILNQFVVEKKDMTVEYVLYNTGSSAATRIELRDDNFPSEYFRVERGLLVAKWPHIPPGANLTHAVVLQPLQHGFFNMTPAVVVYKSSDEAKELTTGFTTSPGEVQIYNLKDYERKFSPHAMDWLSFGLMTTPSLLIPFMLWYQSKSKYEALAKLKKSN